MLYGWVILYIFDIALIKIKIVIYLIEISSNNVNITGEGFQVIKGLFCAQVSCT